MSLSVTLTHQFPGQAIDVHFETPGGLTALFGQSGAGKTTVVNAVAGLLQPNSGKVMVNGATLLDTNTGRNVRFTAAASVMFFKRRDFSRI